MSKCENCGESFSPVNEQHRYCSGSCRVEAFHKRKTGALTPVLTGGLTHKQTPINSVVLSKFEYDELQERVIQAESWNQTKDELIYEHKSTISHWIQSTEFWKLKYDELLKKNADERLEQETRHRQELSKMKEELDGIRLADKITSIFGNLKR